MLQVRFSKSDHFVAALRECCCFLFPALFGFDVNAHITPLGSDNEGV